MATEQPLADVDKKIIKKSERRGLLSDNGESIQTKEGSDDEMAIILKTFNRQKTPTLWYFCLLLLFLFAIFIGSNLGLFFKNNNNEMGSRWLSAPKNPHPDHSPNKNYLNNKNIKNLSHGNKKRKVQGEKTKKENEMFVERSNMAKGQGGLRVVGKRNEHAPEPRQQPRGGEQYRKPVSPVGKLGANSPPAQQQGRMPPGQQMPVNANAQPPKPAAKKNKRRDQVYVTTLDPDHYTLKFDNDTFCMDGHKMPQIYLISTMKCGTGSLTHQLNRLSNFSYGTHKEHIFFNRGQSETKDSRTFVEEFPPCGGNEQLFTFDGTPTYEYK
eukprot:UN24480